MEEWFGCATGGEDEGRVSFHVKVVECGGRVQRAGFGELVLLDEDFRGV